MAAVAGIAAGAAGCRARQLRFQPAIAGAQHGTRRAGLRVTAQRCALLDPEALLDPLTVRDKAAGLARALPD